MAKKKPEKKAAKKAEKPEKKELEVTPRLRRNWLRVRKAYNMSMEAFGSVLSLLNEEEANEMYDLVINALYKDNVAEVVRANPKMREFVKTDDDRFCMYDIYETLSWRLRRKEEPPEYRKKIDNFRLAVKKRLIP